MAKHNGFVEACLNQNTVEELIDGLAAPAADRGDMDAWNISPTEWRESILAALKEALGPEILHSRIPHSTFARA